MKAGARAVGVAESYRGNRSTLAGAVVRADRVLDGLAFGTCTVGGTDATDAISSLVDRLDRPDARYLFVAGIAPAWFNVLDLPALHESVGRPVVSVSFEASPGLGEAIRDAFEGEAAARRLDTYRAQPPRRELSVGEGTLFVRSVGLDGGEAADLVSAFTPEGGRPEPVRVARVAARAADAFRGGGE